MNNAPIEKMPFPEDSQSTPAARDTDQVRPDGAIEVTHFNFEHRVFETPGARFLLKGERNPMFLVDMAGFEALVGIENLKKEFNLKHDSHDGKLIDMAVAGLRYVPDIKPGDTIPSEILTGEASWSISTRHKQIAEQRLQVQLLSWVSGKEVLLTDPKEISSFLEQIENREKLRNAFRDAAAALGQPDDTEHVIRQLELLARELCYIEALRDRFNLIPKIAERLIKLGKSYGNDRSAKMELTRVQGLLNIGIQEYSAMFTEVDAQTGEIIAALKSIDRQVQYIRQSRDDLHSLLMQWEAHINDLPRWQARRTTETDKVMSNLYRYLAPRFSTGRSLLKRRPDGQSPAGKAPAKEIKQRNQSVAS